MSENQDIRTDIITNIFDEIKIKISDIIPNKYKKKKKSLFGTNKIEYLYFFKLFFYLVVKYEDKFDSEKSLYKYIYILISEIIKKKKSKSYKSRIQNKAFYRYFGMVNDNYIYCKININRKKIKLIELIFIKKKNDESNFDNFLKKIFEKEKEKFNDRTENDKNEIDKEFKTDLSLELDNKLKKLK